jgi:hypothetical protein
VQAKSTVEIQIRNSDALEKGNARATGLLPLRRNSVTSGAASGCDMAIHWYRVPAPARYVVKSATTRHLNDDTIRAKHRSGRVRVRQRGNLTNSPQIGTCATKPRGVPNERINLVPFDWNADLDMLRKLGE